MREIEELLTQIERDLNICLFLSEEIAMKDAELQKHLETLRAIQAEVREQVQKKRAERARLIAHDPELTDRIRVAEKERRTDETIWVCECTAILTRAAAVTITC